MELHHLLLYVKNDYIDDQIEILLDLFENDIKYRDKKLCPNIATLMTLHLLTKKKRDLWYIVDEMFARECAWGIQAVCSFNKRISNNKLIEEHVDNPLWEKIVRRNKCI